MEPSLSGVLVFCALLLLGRLLKAPLIVALFASLAFGSTAIVTLSALGGSSPLIYTPFVLLLFATAAGRKSAMADFGLALKKVPAAWLVMAVTCYAIFSAILFPRLFADATTVFNTAPRILSAADAYVGGGVKEMPLGPSSGNITQTAYFALGALMFLTFTILLLRGDNLTAIRRGFFAFCAINALFGVLDLAGKFIGEQDILWPIRTASYSMATSAAEAGFWRIAGGHPEASAFGGAALASVAFTFTYWRVTSSTFALVLTLVLLSLLILSTSTTAYVGLAILAIPVVGSAVVSMLRLRLTRVEIFLAASVLLLFAAALSTALLNEKLADAFSELFETAVLSKGSSSSSLERGYWNAKSVDAFLDTAGFGVGMGSSRASSWIIAVVSQLGVVGSLLMGLMVLELTFGARGLLRRAGNSEAAALALSARACALAILVSASVSAGSADPGVLFFVSFAVMLGCREYALKGVGQEGWAGNRFSSGVRQGAGL